MVYSPSESKPIGQWLETGPIGISGFVLKDMMWYELYITTPITTTPITTVGSNHNDNRLFGKSEVRAYATQYVIAIHKDDYVSADLFSQQIVAICKV